MKNGPLPTDLDIRGLAARGVSIEGTASAKNLPRLAQADCELVGELSAAFVFERDEEGRYTVNSQVQAQVLVTCQRCLRPVEIALSSGSTMACVWDDGEAAELPAMYEPLVIGQTANLNEIAEEEILLAMPVTAVHEEDCRSAEQKAALGMEMDIPDVKPARENPFAVLEKLKT